MKAPEPLDEAARLDTLREYQILDTVAEPAFDDVALLAANICTAPIALIGFVDRDRLWFKSKVGLAVGETSRDVAFCAHAILQPDVLVVPDALADPRFADNPQVTADPKIRFYAGAPLINPDGRLLGTLCVMDRVPRQLTPQQHEALRLLSRQVMTELELRRTRRLLAAADGAQHLLREIEQRYHTVSDLVSDYAYSFRVGPDGTLVNEWVTESFMRVVGLPLDGIRARGGWSRFMHPDDQAIIQEHIQRLFGARTDVAEFRFITHAGEVRWVRNYARRLDDQTPGEVIRIIGAAQDITERKLDEAALRASEDKFRTMAETTTAAVFLYRDDRLIYANPATTTISGYSPDELLGMPLWTLIHPEFHQHVRGRRQARAGGATVPSQSEIKIVTKTGAERWLDYAAGFMTVNGERTGVGTAFDITERRQAEAALATSEKRFRALVEKSSEGVALFTADGTNTYFTPSTPRLFRRSPEDILDRTLFEYMHPDDVPRMRALFAELLQRPGDSVTAECRYSREDGSWRWIEALGTNLLAEPGVEAIVANYRDITERKEAEAERERLQTELRRNELMGALGSLVAGVAHEVRNPLFGISATLDAFEARFGDRQEYERYMATLRIELTRLNDLMRDLLDYGRAHQVVLTPGSVEEVAAEAVVAFAAFARESDIRIVTSVTRASPPVAMDRTALRRVFENLLRNAIQLSTRGSEVQLAIRGLVENGWTWVECVVEDRGPGFRAEDLPRVFEPFFTRRKGGTGLGLSIVQRIVEQHQGTIGAANRPEGGAVIMVKLPCIGRAADH